MRRPVCFRLLADGVSEEAAVRRVVSPTPASPVTSVTDATQSSGLNRSYGLSTEPGDLLPAAIEASRGLVPSEVDGSHEFS